MHPTAGPTSSLSGQTLTRARLRPPTRSQALTSLCASAPSLSPFSSSVLYCWIETWSSKNTISFSLSFLSVFLFVLWLWKEKCELREGGGVCCFKWVCGVFRMCAKAKNRTGANELSLLSFMFPFLSFSFGFL